MSGAAAVVALVLLEWVAGWMGAAAWTQSWAVVKRGHFRILAWGAILLGVAALLASREAASGLDAGWARGLTVALAASACVYLLAQYVRTDMPGTVVGIAGAVIGAAALVANGSLIDGWGPTGPLQLISGAALLGAVTNGMLLGHWYLNQPGLKPWALARLTSLSLVAVIASAAAGLLAAGAWGLVRHGLVSRLGRTGRTNRSGRVHGNAMREDPFDPVRHRSVLHSDPDGGSVRIPRPLPDGERGVSGPKLGVTLPQFTSERERVLDGARRAEAAGLDSIWLFDHLWPLSGGKSRPILESWTTLAYLAARTARITLGTLVTRSSLRHPAVLAKMAATAADVAPGRVIVVIGSGDDLSRAENTAFGLPYFEGRERAGQLASVVEVVQRSLGSGEVSYRDAFSTLDALPARAPDPAPAIWVGGRARDTLRIAGRLADGWNSWASTPEQFSREAAIVDEAAAGRAVELSWGGLVALGRTEAEAVEKLGDRKPAGWVVGEPGAVRDRLGALSEAGAGHLIVTLADAGKPGGYELLSETLRP
jgi:alkanesulfonate monooxygenase SsuD/methylene tetrahydromethanopterin reductase-like flavin-dependent oxidoreductase (luciferase family)